MAAREDRLLDLAMSLSDGAAVDWERAEREETDEQGRRLLAHLRILARIAQAYRDDPEDGRASPTPTPEDTRTLFAPAGPEFDHPAASPRAPEPLPAEWGHLRLIEAVGGGAFGEVYRAWDRQLEREVALKLLRVDEPERQNAALREGRLLARVRHPNVVTVYGADRIEERVGLWMEFIRGRTLAQILREQGPLGPREAVLIGLDLCRALAAVHRAGLVHGDVKAQNVMREEGGRIVLMDFGAGRDVGRVRHGLSGTPLYMPPETLQGAPPGPPGDIYSLGVLLYHVVTGAYPVQGKTLGELCEAHERQEPRRLRDARPDLPEAFVRSVERALAPGRERYESAGEMEAALLQGLGLTPAEGPAGQRRPTRALPARLLRVGVPVAAALLVAWALAWRSGPSQSPPLTVPARSEDGIRETLKTLTTAAGLYAAMGAYEKARPLYERAVALAEARRGGDTTEVADLLTRLAWVHDAGGNRDQARLLYQRATALDQRARPHGTSSATLEARLDDLGEGLTATGPYTVSAGLYLDAAGGSRRLEPGGRVAPGDRLFLEIAASRSLYVYVLSEDDRGEIYLLFPLPGYDLANPLAAERTHRLPGSQGGRQVFWRVTSAGGKEHVLVVASPVRLAEIEHEIRALPHPRPDRPVTAAPLSDGGAGRLRGIGGLVEAPPPSRGAARHRVFALARSLAREHERVRGAWIRQIDLENPPS